MAYKDQIAAEFHICRSESERKRRNLRAALTMVAAGGLVALGGTIDPNETSQFANIVQNLGLTATTVSTIAGAILTGMSHSKYSEYLRLENKYNELTFSINELKGLERRRNITDEVREDIEYYEEMRDNSFRSLVNHFANKYNVASIVSKCAKGGAWLSAVAGTALPFAAKMNALAGVATAATGVVVAGICGLTASNYSRIAKTNKTTINCLKNICIDGPQQRKEFPGVEYWEMV